MSDTIAQLQTALTPKTGMQRIPLALETYRHPSIPLTSKYLLNMFSEQEPADARTAAALLPVPGLGNFLNVGSGPIHAINDDQPGAVYCVSGTHFYILTPDVGGTWTATDLGNIGTPTGGTDPANLFYSIAVGPTAAVVCSPPNAYVSVDGGPVAQITTTWPSYGASSVAYLDGYFVFTGLTSPEFFFITKLLDPTMVDALDFAALDAFPNAMVKVVALGSDLWFAGATGWEIWYDTGNADFPFRRRPNGIIQRPVISPQSVAKGDQRVFWWSADGRVYRSTGYQAERISNHGIESWLTSPAQSSFVYSQFGHAFYVLNLADKTLVYDAATQVWHNAASSTDGSGRWRAECATLNQGTPIIGDVTAGRILVPTVGLSTDVGVNVMRQVVLPPLYAGTKRAFCSRLEVEMEVGTVHSPANVLLEWSDDGGITYTGYRTLTLGSTGHTRSRVYTTRLGSFRNRVFRLTCLQFMTVYAVDADLVAGAH